MVIIRSDLFFQYLIVMNIKIDSYSFKSFSTLSLYLGFLSLEQKKLYYLLKIFTIAIQNELCTKEKTTKSMELNLN